MQHPTLQNVRIRSTRDALQVFHGVATHCLPLITRRLDAEERRNIVPGNVYVWEERGANTEPTGLGMERWCVQALNERGVGLTEILFSVPRTDGMGWGPSRVRDEFLFYHQKESDVADDLVNPVTPWAQMMRRPAARLNSRPFSTDIRSVPEAERLIKQTYSVHVSLPADKPRGIVRKWHLTAYFSPSKLDELNTIDNIRGVGDVVVPDGWFRSARIGRTRRDSRSAQGSMHQPEASQPSPATNVLNLHHTSSSHQRYPSSSQYTTSSTASGYSSPVSPSPPHSVAYEASHRSMNQLVPIDVLVRTTGPRRDPADELLLRKFSS